MRVSTDKNETRIRLHGAAVPERVHRVLKILAAERGVTLTALITDLILSHPAVAEQVERRFGERKTHVHDGE